MRKTQHRQNSWPLQVDGLKAINPSTIRKGRPLTAGFFTNNSSRFQVNKQIDRPKKSAVGDFRCMHAARAVLLEGA
jgi:hypothetical protein